MKFWRSKSTVQPKAPEDGGGLQWPYFISKWKTYRGVYFAYFNGEMTEYEAQEFDEKFFVANRGLAIGIVWAVERLTTTGR